MSKNKKIRIHFLVYDWRGRRNRNTYALHIVDIPAICYEVHFRGGKL